MVLGQPEKNLSARLLPLLAFNACSVCLYGIYLCAVQRNRRGHIKCQEVGEVEQFAAWRLAYLKGYGLIAVSDADIEVIYSILARYGLVFPCI